MGGVTTFSRADKPFLREVGLTAPMTIVSTAVDSGNTGQTHILRAALVLGKVTASGKLAQYNNAASDGTEVAYAILIDQVDLKDGDPAASATDHAGHVLLIGVVDPTYLIGYDAAAKTDLQTTAARIWFI